MLEAYELRDALRKARKELAESLYQHDAACRVIARLQIEKEAAEKALEDLKGQVVQLRNQAVADVPAEAAAEGPQPKRVQLLPCNAATANHLISSASLYHTSSAICWRMHSAQQGYADLLRPVLMMSDSPPGTVACVPRCSCTQLCHVCLHNGSPASRLVWSLS